MELQKIELDKKNKAVSKSEPVTPARVTNRNIPDSGSLNSSKNNMTPKIIGLVIALALGLGSGYLLKIVAGGKATAPEGAPVGQTGGMIKEGDVVGLPESHEFKDSTSGFLDKGGLDGEGSHRLLRPGGTSQTVYLTSSVIDLDEYVGSQVTVWGETFKGQKAGWLMDVGRLRVEKLNAQAPE